MSRPVADRGGEAPYDDDDDLIRDVLKDGLPRLRIYRPDRVRVVLGRGGDASAELDLRACAEDGILIERRRGGGCAVVLDPGNAIIAFAAPVKGYGDNDRHFRHLTRWVLDGLAGAGAPGGERRGICDLALGNRKIGGACIQRSRGVLFYSTTVLVDPDLSRIDRYLRHPPREPDYRAGRDHRAFLTTLAEQGFEGEADDLVRRLSRTLTPGGAVRALSRRRAKDPGGPAQP